MERHGGKHERVTRLFANSKATYAPPSSSSTLRRRRRRRRLLVQNNPFERMGEFRGTFFDVCRVLFVMWKNRLDLGDQGWMGGGLGICSVLRCLFVCVFAAGYSSDKLFQLGSRD